MFFVDRLRACADARSRPGGPALRTAPHPGHRIGAGFGGSSVAVDLVLTGAEVRRRAASPLFERLSKTRRFGKPDPLSDLIDTQMRVLQKLGGHRLPYPIDDRL